jgi:hypothetical protein
MINFFGFLHISVMSAMAHIVVGWSCFNKFLNFCFLGTILVDCKFRVYFSQNLVFNSFKQKYLRVCIPNESILK